jgi:hypothetical protein
LPCITKLDVSPRLDVVENPYMITTDVESNGEGFRAAASALRSLDEKDGMRFHTFTLPE